jgi:hypothetical protein
MRIFYSPIAAFLCRHGYFVDGVGRALRMSPTACCLRLMRRHRLMLQEQPGGGTIHAGRDEAGLLAAQLDPATPLGFALTYDDPCFVNYTACDWAPGFIVHYSNLASAGAPGVQEPGVNELSGETLALKSRAFMHRFATPQRGASIAIVRVADSATVFSAPAPAGAFETLALDLRALDEGRYRLCIDGAAALDFYLSDADAPGLWGVLDLYGLGGLVGSAAAPAVPARYAISLAARATIWRYVVLGAATGADLAVAGRLAPKQPIAFTGPTPTSFGDLPALSFDSAAPIAWRERPGDLYAMSLTIRGGGAAGETTVGLAYPGPATPVAGGAAGAPGVSEIVVNV